MFWNSYEEDVSAYLAGCFCTNVLCAATVEVFLSCSSWSRYLGRPEESRDRYFRFREQGAHLKSESAQAFEIITLFDCVSQDSAIVCVIDGHRGQHMTSNFLEMPYPISSFRGRRDHRGYYPRRQFSHRGPPQVHTSKYFD